MGRVFSLFMAVQCMALRKGGGGVAVCGLRLIVVGHISPIHTPAGEKLY